MSTTTAATKRDAEKFLSALRRQHKAHIEATGSTPTLMRDWDWTGYGGARWSIVWEEGPFEWAVSFPYGGRDQEFGFQVADVSATLPTHLYAEPVTGWAVAIYEV